MSLLPNYTHPTWRNLLTDEFLLRLSTIEAQLNTFPIKTCGYSYFPEKQNVMRFLSMNVKEIKCVIIGMEPYPSYYQKGNKILPVATGRSFEIANVTSWDQKFKQSSLRNILKTVYFNETGEKKSLEEVRKEIKEGKFFISQPDEWFENLEKEGVLFLNATLTVEPGKPNTHTQVWEEVMNEIIDYIEREVKPKWLLFGNKAEERLLKAIGINGNIYKCHHPRLASFVDENIFKNIPDIKWNI